MTRYIGSNLLRGTLQAVKRASGPQYAQILEQAGMLRYLDTLPPPDESPSVTPEEYSRLPAAVFSMLGEHLTRLFLRNLGTLGATRMQQGPLVPKWAAQAAGVPPDQRLAWFVQWAAATNERIWTHSPVTEDADAWYITMDVCANCLGIHNVSEPICANSTYLYMGLAEPIIGQKVRVTEVECAAMGAPHCKFAFYK
jgi:hypothetical protein